MKLLINESQLNVYDQYLVETGELGNKKAEIEKHIRNARGISDENKEFALNNYKTYSEIKKSRIFNLNLHPKLKEKIKNKKLPNGFDMGIDKDGFFIHTHRARSKSYENPENISVKDIKFIDSTG